VDRGLVAALFTGTHAEAESIAVTLRPLVYRARTEHGRARLTLPPVITPIASKVTLMRDGRLVSPVATVALRNLLEPLDRTAFTIGTIERSHDKRRGRIYNSVRPRFAVARPTRYTSTSRYSQRRSPPAPIQLFEPRACLDKQGHFDLLCTPCAQATSSSHDGESERLFRTL
jgi:hypothetical protein